MYLNYYTSPYYYTEQSIYINWTYKQNNDTDNEKTTQTFLIHFLQKDMLVCRFIASTMLPGCFSDKKNVVQPFQENCNNSMEDFGLK